MARTIAVDPGAPVPLPPGETAWRVERGEVEVYLVSPERRKLIAVVGEGAHVFPLPEAASLSLSLVAPAPVELVAAPGDDRAVRASAEAWIAASHRLAGIQPPALDDGDLAAAVARITIALDGCFAAAERAGDAALAARIGGGPTADERRATMAEALADAGAALGVEIDPRALPARDDFMAAPALARIAGLRAARVILPPGWDREDLGPLLLRRLADGAVVAVVWSKRRYRAGDEPIAPEDHDSLAFRVYAPLKDDVSSFTGMARMVVRLLGDDIGWVVGAGLGAALLGLLVPMATGWIFDEIVPMGAGGLLISVGVALLVAALVSAALATVRAMAVSRIGGRGAAELAAGVTDRVLRLPARFFKTVPAGDLNQRLDSIEAIRRLVTGTLLSAGLTALFSLVYLLLLFVYDVRLALAGLALTLVYVGGVALARAFQMRPLREAAERDGRLAGLTFELLAGIAKLRTAAAEGRMLSRWSRAYAAERSASAAGERVGNHFFAFAESWRTVTLIGLFAAGALLATSDLSAGTFIAFLTAFAIFQGSFTGFCEALLAIQVAKPLAERAAPILAAAPESGAGRADPGRLSGDIQASGLSFAYDAAIAPVIDGLGFAVRRGEHLAIVGGSGSGKSTILRLLLGFENPATGSLTYDGQELWSLDPARVRAQIGVVLQSSQLFAGTINENIRGASDAGLERCMAAAERAGLGPDLRALPMGLHTPITEGAGTLSGGQRQRILIARALAADPAILFLDEATSALDNATQAVVAATLDSLAATRITIAHRLSTVRNADRIAVLEGGRFVEEGDFETLMAADGVFAMLARRQLLES